MRRPRPARQSSKDRLATLTAREREVLARVATGARTREIATSLGISEPTVKRHLTNLYRKLGVTNRVAAATTYVTARRRDR